MRWLFGVVIAGLSIVVLFLVAYLFIGDFGDTDVDPSPSHPVSVTPDLTDPPQIEGTQQIPDAEEVFREFGATVDGTSVVFPSDVDSRSSVVFDCNGWDLTLDGFHARYVLVGECGSVTVAGTHMTLAAEHIDELVHIGTHATVIVPTLGHARVDASHGALIAEYALTLSGSAAFPKLIIGDVGTDESDFTFGTVINDDGLAPEAYADAFTPELLGADEFRFAGSGETLMMHPESNDHECSGENIVISGGREPGFASLYGSCGVVVVATSDEVFVEEADVVIVLSDTARVDIGTANNVITARTGGDLYAESIETVMNAGSALFLDTWFLGSLMSVENPDTVIWEDGMDGEDAVLPEGSDPLEGP